MTVRIRSAFTLVEMLVVVAIIGVLASMMLPAVQFAREMARSADCSHRMSQLAKACIQFESQKSRYPGWKDRPRWVNKTVAPPVEVAQPWTVVILPYMDRNNLYDEWKDAIENGSAAGSAPRDPAFVCPSDGLKLQGSRISFVANGGAVGTVAEHFAHGIMHNYFDTGLRCADRYIKDGKATTLLLSENNAATTWPALSKVDTVFVWHLTDTPQVRRLNVDREASLLPNGDVSRPSSYHAGFVNVAFCDGHTRKIRDAVDYRIYRELMTPNGRMSVAQLTAPGFTHFTPSDEDY